MAVDNFNSHRDTLSIMQVADN